LFFSRQTRARNLSKRFKEELFFITFSEQGADLENIMWLTLDNIGEGGEECRVPGPAGLVGSGKAVGGVVSKVG